MRERSRFWSMLMLILALSACLPQQIAIPASQVPQSGTPSVSMTNTATLPATTPALAPPIVSLKMIDANDGWAWTNTNRLLRTNDGGQTWLDRTPGGQIISEGFFPLDAQTAWLTTFLEDSGRFGILQTKDGGQTWTQYPYGPASGLHFIDRLNGWAVTGNPGAGNIYYTLSETTDGGKTWAPIPARPPTAEEGLPPGTIHLCNMCADSFFYNPGRMIIVYGDMGSMEARGSVQVRISFDLGKTWRMQNLPFPNEYKDALVSPYQPTFFDDKNGLLPVSLVKLNNDGSFAYERLVFYVSQDGGASWTLAPDGLDVPRYSPMQIVSSMDIYVLCGKSLCASHDGAQTWQTLASNLDFTQSNSRSVSALDFIDSNTGWALIQENETTKLYKTIDGGGTWNQLTPMLVASAPVMVTIDISIPTPTLVPTETGESTPTPDVAFDQKANAYRVRFATGGTWVEYNDTISANTPKSYILSAMKGQIMSVSIPQGPPFSVNLTGADQKSLSDSRYPMPFWRGMLPSTQDYIVSVESQVNAPFTLRVAIDPPGQATQNFSFSDPQYQVSIAYTDEFAPTSVEIPAASTKGSPVLTLAFIDPTFYFPRTNLNEAYLLLTATSDPAIVATCTQPSTQVAEAITGQESINNQSFTRSEFIGAAAGNRYDQVAYRTVWKNQCFEVIFLIHSSEIGNYPAGTVVEYDHTALLAKFEAILNSFQVK